MNKDILIIYKSKTGFTEQYARWISEELPGRCELVPYDKRKSACMDEYACVLFGSYLHAGSISGLKWLKTKLPELAKRPVAVFVTGAMPPEAPDVPKTLERNFTPGELERIKVFYLHGGLRYEKMGLNDKAMMAVFRGMMKKSQGEDSEIYKTISKSFDGASSAAVSPIVGFVKSF